MTLVGVVTGVRFIGGILAGLLPGVDGACGDMEAGDRLTIIEAA